VPSDVCSAPERPENENASPDSPPAGTKVETFDLSSLLGFASAADSQVVWD